jgi:hypothetical protein
MSNPVAKITTSKSTLRPLFVTAPSGVNLAMGSLMSSTLSLWSESSQPASQASRLQPNATT